MQFAAYLGVYASRLPRSMAAWHRSSAQPAPPRRPRQPEHLRQARNRPSSGPGDRRPRRVELHGPGLRLPRLSRNCRVCQRWPFAADAQPYLAESGDAWPGSPRPSRPLPTLPDGALRALPGDAVEPRNLRPARPVAARRLGHVVPPTPIRLHHVPVTAGGGRQATWSALPASLALTRWLPVFQLHLAASMGERLIEATRLRLA